MSTHYFTIQPRKTEVGTLNSSRPTVIALSIFTLRLVENWRSMLDAIMSEPADVDTVLILVAVAAVGGEKFKRGGLEDELQSLSVAMPEGRLTKCNVSSIAAATGMNSGNRSPQGCETGENRNAPKGRRRRIAREPCGRHEARSSGHDSISASCGVLPD